MVLINHRGKEKQKFNNKTLLWFVNAMFCIPQMLLNSPYLGFIGETFLNIHS